MHYDIVQASWCGLSPQVAVHGRCNCNTQSVILTASSDDYNNI